MENIDEIVDKIARFFEEDEHNWYALHNCWMANGYSEDLRRLLKQALK